MVKAIGMYTWHLVLSTLLVWPGKAAPLLLAMADLASLKKAVTFERKRLTEICKLITLQ